MNVCELFNQSLFLSISKIKYFYILVYLRYFKGIVYKYIFMTIPSKIYIKYLK